MIRSGFIGGVLLLASFSIPALASEFYFAPSSTSLMSERHSSGSSLLSGLGCGIPSNDQVRRGPYCPIPPKRKNGQNCYAGSIPSFDRHATGYEQYLTAEILEASRQTQALSAEGVSPLLLFSIMAKESFFNPMSYNRWKDMGIAQFQIGTANATLDYMREFGLQVPERASDRVPPNCQRNSYSSPLSRSCFRSIRENCSKPEYSNSLFCPSFAVRLMAFHLLQIQQREVGVDIDDRRWDLVLLLSSESEAESGLRHLLSVYNRGFRIYNSAYYQYLAEGSWRTASEYGRLWSQRRLKPKSEDPYPGGTLSGHYINRCYVWAIGGLCGGIKNSIVDQFKSRLCSSLRQLPVLSKGDWRHQVAQRRTLESDRHYRRGEFEQAALALQRELRSPEFSASGPRHRWWRMALNLYANAQISTSELKELIEHEAVNASGDEFWQVISQARQQVVRHAPLSSAEALALLEKLRSQKLSGDSLSNIERQAGFQFLQAHAKKNLAKSSAESRLLWHYLAGAAGFYDFGGHRDSLQEYVENCSTLKAPRDRSASSCRYLNEAQRMLSFQLLGEQEKWQRSENH